MCNELDEIFVYTSVDGVWGDWGLWSSCPVTCGGGQITRSRSCEYPDPENPGEPCVGSDTQNFPCNQNTCPGKVPACLAPLCSFL